LTADALVALKTMQVEPVTESDRVQALRPEWRELCTASSWPNVFLTGEWVAAYCAYEAGQARPFVLTLRQSGRLGGVLPLVAVGSPPWKLRFATHPQVAEYADVLAPAGAEATVAQVALEWLAAQRGLWSRLELPRVRETSPLLAALRQGAAQRHWNLVERARPASLCITLPSDWETFVRSSDRLKRIARYMRKCVRELGVHLKVYRRPEEIAQGLETLFDLHQRRWAERPGSSNFLPMRAFMDQTAAPLAEADLIRVFVLHSGGGEALAAWLAYVCGDQVFSFQTGFDPGWQEYKVGTVLLGFVLQRAIEEGYREFDFLGGDAEYKHYWSNQTRGKRDVMLFPPTWQGRCRATQMQWLLRLRQAGRQVVGRRPWSWPRRPRPRAEQTERDTVGAPGSARD